MEPNETAVPSSDDVQMDEQGRLVPAYALYNATGVAWATFLGSLLGGSVVMAINYGRLGRQDARRQALIGGVRAVFPSTSKPPPGDTRSPSSS